jgi:hypothetical protein
LTTEYQDLLNDIVLYLKDNLPDPNDDRNRRGLDWIITDFPELVNVEFPLICVIYTQVSRNEQGVGSGKRYTDSMSLRIAILVDHTGRYNIAGEDVERWDAADKLLEEVQDLLEGNDTKFQEWGWTRPIPENVNRYNQDDGIGFIADYRIRRWDTGG